MTSKINPTNIDSSYPIAGQDNDSQGFRDNFFNIVNNFKAAQQEINDIQSKAIFSSPLEGQTLNNDFKHAILANVQLRAMTETSVDHGAWDGDAQGPLLISYDQGTYHKVQTANWISLSIPPYGSGLITRSGGEVARFRIEIDVTNTDHYVIVDAGNFIGWDNLEGGITDNNRGNWISFSRTGTFVYEFWTTDGGSTLQVANINKNYNIVDTLTVGTLTVNDGFTVSSATTIENNLTVTGNLNVTGTQIITTTEIVQGVEVVAGNLVANSGTTSSSSTTGALVVAGGAGVSGNVNIDGNLWVNSGNLRTSSTVGNIFNVTCSTINLGNVASVINMGAANGNVNHAGNVVAKGNIIASGGRINSNYLYLTRTTGATLTANTAIEQYFMDSSPSGATIASQTISLPTGAEDGRRIEFNALCPITSTTWTGGSVKYAPSGVFSAGNVSVKLMWSSTQSAWLRR